MRDVYVLYDERLHLMLDRDDPLFPNWDQDETAVTDRYGEQDPSVVAHTFTVEPGDIFLRLSLFDASTDGNDDLDLYLYYCPTLDACTQVGQSGSFTSAAEIALL